jgi:hypothetical protein
MIHGLLNKISAQPTGSEAKLVVIVNWFTEVRRKLKQTGR